MDPISPTANTESTPSVPIAALHDKKGSLVPISSKLAELNESRSELHTRIQSLKQDMQNWRSKLDTQVTVYRNLAPSSLNGMHLINHKELSELKKSLNVEVVQLRADFEELRTTLQQQQEDVAASLKSLGLQDSSEDNDGVKTEIEGTNNEEAKIEEDTGEKIKIAGNEGDAASPVKANEKEFEH